MLGQFECVLDGRLGMSPTSVGISFTATVRKRLHGSYRTVLAISSGWVIQHGHGWAYSLSADFGSAVIVGIAATPLAPVAKDLASSLQAAADAVCLVRRS